MKSYVFLYLCFTVGWQVVSGLPEVSQSFIFVSRTYIPVTLLNFFNYLTITSLSNFRSELLE